MWKRKTYQFLGHRDCHEETPPNPEENNETEFAPGYYLLQAWCCCWAELTRRPPGQPSGFWYYFITLTTGKFFLPLG